MSLDKAIKNLKFDKRMVEWNLNNGLLTKEEYEKYVQQLPDLKEQVNLLDLEAETEDTNEPH